MRFVGASKLVPDPLFVCGWLVLLQRFLALPAGVRQDKLREPALHLPRVCAVCQRPCMCREASDSRLHRGEAGEVRVVALLCSALLCGIDSHALRPFVLDASPNLLYDSFNTVRSMWTR